MSQAFGVSLRFNRTKQAESTRLGATGGKAEVSHYLLFCCLVLYVFDKLYLFAENNCIHRFFNRVITLIQFFVTNFFLLKTRFEYWWGSVNKIFYSLIIRFSNNQIMHHFSQCNYNPSFVKIIHFSQITSSFDF